jgi:HlyD family secretion protein
MNQQQNQEILLRSELAMLKVQQNGLVKISDFNGVVENVYVKAGEVVEEYTDLLAVLPSAPGSVVAYMASGANPPVIGSLISVVGVGDPDLSVEGKVIGHGSIVPLPDILQKATAVKAFGKEIFIEIPVGNTFSTGEKVLVKQKI